MSLVQYNTILRATNIILDQQLKDCRKLLAESVCKECKCKVNTSVNHDLVDRNLKLKEQNKIMREALEFYADTNNWNYGNIADDISDVNGSLEAGKTARQALEKMISF